MAFWNRRDPAEAPSLEGVRVQVRPQNKPRLRGRRPGLPRMLGWGVALAAVFYLLAHFSIISGVWPVHGTAPGAGGVLMRDMVAGVAWLLLLPLLKWLGYRGSWAVVALPIILFFVTRPSLFQLFSDPVYQASGSTRAEANSIKAERAQLTTILRAYDEERQEIVFRGAPPELPNPIEAVSEATRDDPRSLARMASFFTVFVAPLALLLAFLWARRAGALRMLREHRLWPFLVSLGVFFALALFFTELGKVGGTTPWELLLPIFVLTWAAFLADDAYNLARPGEVASVRRIGSMLIYGALPVVPFLLIRELGLSIVLAGSLATMLLVGTRRGWWAGLMLVVWAVLVMIAFNVDERSATRLELAYEPYPQLEIGTPAAEAWAAKLHQIKLFDANILDGGLFGEGAGRGHAGTAPNAADDGYITTIAAQWGLFGGLSLVLLYTLFLIQMLAVAVDEQSAFERSMVTGLAMLIAIPFWLATLGGIRVIPLTGVAAGFIANGGAKLLASAIAVGLIAAVSHRRAEAQRLDAPQAVPGARSESGVRIR